MAIVTVTGFTADRMRQIQNESVVSGVVSGANLILRRRDGQSINAGSVRGPRGLPGMNAAPTDLAVAGYVAAEESETGTEVRVAASDVLHTEGYIVENVLKYGAVGDGVTDCTAAIQAAIDSLPLNTADTVAQTPKGFANGGTIHIPPGRYVVSDTIHLRRGVRIIGSGRESSQIISKTPHTVLQYRDVGRYIQDEIVVSDLSIWQHDSVPSTDGAGIHVGFGVGNPVQSTNLIVSNLIIEGTYRGLVLEAGVWSSIRNVNINKCSAAGFVVRWTDPELVGSPTVSSTSVTFDACYASQCGIGYYIQGGAYIVLTGCASDSNVTHGYYAEGTKALTLTSCGAEENGSAGAYLKDTAGALLTMSVVYNHASGQRYGVSLENTRDTVIMAGSMASNGTGAVTGVRGHATLQPSRTTIIGTMWEGGFVGNAVDHTFRVTDFTAPQALVGTAGGGFAVGGSAQGDPTASFLVGGAMAPGMAAGLKVNSQHTAAVSPRNVGAQVQVVTANTAVTYPQVASLLVPAVSKGAASTVERNAGVYVVQGSAASVSNVSFFIDAGMGQSPAGDWAIYSGSERDSVFTGPIRLGSSNGPRVYSGPGNPEGSRLAPQGSLFLRTDGGAGSTMYVKESGGSTPSTSGWVGK